MLVTKALAANELMKVPALGAVTSTTTSQEEAGAMVPPVRAIVELPVVAEGVPPQSLLTMLATSREPGKVSVKVAPVAV